MKVKVTGTLYASVGSIKKPFLPAGYFSGVLDMDNEIKDLEDLFDEGLNRFNADKYGDAIGIFSKVLDLNPEHSDALYYRAISWMNQKNFDRAIADFTQAVNQDPNDADAWIGRGEVWQRKGDVKHALDDFKKALELDPDNPGYKRLVSSLEEK